MSAVPADEIYAGQRPRPSHALRCAGRPHHQVKQSFESSLAHLHTDYLDSYVLHGPITSGTWRRRLGSVGGDREALQNRQDRKIGISNVSADQLRLLCERAVHKPMVVPNRCYAALGWDPGRAGHLPDTGIIYQGSRCSQPTRDIFADPELHAMAAKCGMGLAQWCFRFCDAGWYVAIDRRPTSSI